MDPPGAWRDPLDAPPGAPPPVLASAGTPLPITLTTAAVTTSPVHAFMGAPGDAGRRLFEPVARSYCAATEKVDSRVTVFPLTLSFTFNSSRKSPSGKLASGTAGLPVN